MLKACYDFRHTCIGDWLAGNSIIGEYSYSLGNRVLAPSIGKWIIVLKHDSVRRVDLEPDRFEIETGLNWKKTRKKKTRCDPAGWLGKTRSKTRLQAFFLLKRRRFNLKKNRIDPGDPVTRSKPGTRALNRAGSCEALHICFNEIINPSKILPCHSSGGVSIFIWLSTSRIVCVLVVWSVIKRFVSAGQSACWKYDQKINLQIIKNTYEEFPLEKQDQSWKWLCLDNGAVHVKKSPYISKNLGFFLRTVMNSECGCLFPLFFIFLSSSFSQFYIQKRI